jgi:glutamate 5-kinase
VTEGLRRDAARAKRIVVKIGSGTLTEAGRVRTRVVSDLTRQIAALADAGKEVVVVSSGAIAIGSHALRWKQPGKTIPEKQAAAAVGQIGLLELWRKALRKHGRQVAQILVTRSGLEDREGFLNARNTLAKLIELGVIPVVNENDTVATEEIRFGDNDNLSATMVNLIGAELLVILTDVDGLYQAPPENGKPLPPLVGVVENVADVAHAAGGAGTTFGRGGMVTKLEAARSAAGSGAATVLCHGRAKDVLLRVAAGEAVGTLFRAGNKLASKKHRIAFTAKPRGVLVLDEGAVRALTERGRSLLPAGVVRAEGEFQRGDPVACVDAQGREFARGLATYSAAEVERIKGAPTSRILAVLGFTNGDEVIHRDDLVLLPSRPPNS